MKKIMTVRLVILLAIASAGSLLAHHSLANYDITKAVRVKGTVVQFHQVNPHSIIFLEEKSADGQMHRWAIEGPAMNQLARLGFAKEVVKAGDVIEVCGYLPKETIMWQIANADTSAVNLVGRLFNAEYLIMPDGKQQSWGDYGVHKCFAPGFVDQHSPK